MARFAGPSFHAGSGSTTGGAAPTCGAVASRATTVPPTTARTLWRQLIVVSGARRLPPHGRVANANTALNRGTPRDTLASSLDPRYHPATMFRARRVLFAA